MTRSRQRPTLQIAGRPQQVQADALVFKIGILIKQMGFANRATFVVDRDGKIQSIEEGSSALDPSGAEKTCSLIFHKK